MRPAWRNFTLKDFCAFTNCNLRLHFYNMWTDMGNVAKYSIEPKSGQYQTSPCSLLVAVVIKCMAGSKENRDFDPRTNHRYMDLSG